MSPDSNKVRNEPIYDKLVDQLSEIGGYSRARINGLWNIKLKYQPAQGERLFEYEVIVCQTNIGQGASYAFEDIDSQRMSRLIGSSISDIDFMDYNDYSLKVAILDSIYAGHFPWAPNLDLSIAGRSSAKASTRAEIVTAEAVRLINRRCLDKGIKGDVPVILNIGFVSRFRTVLKEMFPHEFYATDLHPDLVGRTLDGVRIDDGLGHNEEYLKKADVAIITGMTITTRTLSSLTETAKRYGTDVVIFSETGYNISAHYVRYGVESVICEEFPYYIFDGSSNIRVFRKKCSS